MRNDDADVMEIDVSEQSEYAPVRIWVGIAWGIAFEILLGSVLAGMWWMVRR